MMVGTKDTLNGYAFGPDSSFRYQIDEDAEFALRDVSIALAEIAMQYDRADIEDVSGSGMAAIFRTFSRATGNIAISATPAPKSFR